MATVSHKLKGAFDGALAGGGDPISSPLYVFGPFLKLIVISGVASITFGASIWLAILTVITVSAVYKLVMSWVIDGSGGSGLCEEEFGSWAVKINSSITIIEYILTYLVSVAALVTFLADRIPHFSEYHFGYSLRTYVAVIVTVLIAVGVNSGPRISVKLFGPATFGVFILLWLLIFSTIWHYGLHFPPLHLSAFHISNIHYTLGGYAKILALMTGIEVFANLVAAYQGSAKERSKKAFGSLIIIMGTTSLTLLIVGPAILQLSDPSNPEVSVFTQTMDHLLPLSLSYFGTFLGVMVLLSAAAASAQGIQNLALGLRYRHYIPAWLGSLNRFDVANKPVWLVVLICIACFLTFGTSEETYLALYAAGVFILLSLTSWASVKRLSKSLTDNENAHLKPQFIACVVAAILTTLATFIIFEERLLEGAWIYFLLVPILYSIFSYTRKRLEAPAVITERIGRVLYSSIFSDIHAGGVFFKNILVPLDSSPGAEHALSCAQTIARHYNGKIRLLSVLGENGKAKNGEFNGNYIPHSMYESIKEYLDDVVADLVSADYRTSYTIRRGNPAQEIGAIAKQNIDLLIMTSQGRSLVNRWLISHTTTDVIHLTTPPLIVLRPTDTWRSIRTTFKRLLVTLDASETAEQILPYAKEIASKFESKIELLLVPEASDSDELIQNLEIYLKKIAKDLNVYCTQVTTHITGSDPAKTIIEMSKTLKSDLVMMTTHGRGGIQRQEHVKIGSVTETVMQDLPCPIFIVSAK